MKHRIEQVHIPVVMSEPGLDVVYNDFYVEDGADVTIVAGCGTTVKDAAKPVTMVFILSMSAKMPM